jgi:nucleoside-diphosphate-sugar epimerase
MKVVITGGSGKTGRWVVRHLRSQGHEVLSVDVTPGDRDMAPSLTVDLTDLGQCHDVLAGSDAVVHLAAIPAWGIRSEGETFRNNVLSTYNVFSAAVAHRHQRVIYASSETAFGVPFEKWPPAFAPIDESIKPCAESSYALSKIIGEQVAYQLAHQSGIPFIGLRLSNVIEPADYASFPSFWSDATQRRWNLWGYVDVRDVAQAIEKSLVAPVSGSVVCIIAADDTVMPQPSAELMAEVWPGVELRRQLSGRETLLSIDTARDVLGFVPEHHWKDHVRAG